MMKLTRYKLALLLYVAFDFLIGGHCGGLLPLGELMAAQSGPPAIGNITSAGSTCSTTSTPTNCVILQLDAATSAATIQVIGTYSATNQFEVSSDNQTTWSNVSCTPPNSATAVSSTTSTGLWQCNVAGYTHIRARASAYTSGTAAITINSGHSVPSIVTGTTAPVSPVTPGTASVNTLGGSPMICDSTATGTVTAGQAQMVKCSTTGVLATVINAGNTDSVTANEGALEQIGSSGLPLQVAPKLFNGSTTSRPYAASSANLTAASTLTARNSAGAQLVERGSRWSVTSAPAAASQGTASIALEAGVKHVASMVCFSAGAIAAPAATSLQVNIRDGATGAGTVLMTFEIAIPAAAGNLQPAFCTGDLNLVGTAGTAMTAEWSGGLANLKESVSIIGYNVN